MVTESSLFHFQYKEATLNILKKMDDRAIQRNFSRKLYIMEKIYKLLDDKNDKPIIKSKPYKK